MGLVIPARMGPSMSEFLTRAEVGSEDFFVSAIGYLVAYTKIVYSFSFVYKQIETENVPVAYPGRLSRAK